MKCGVCDSTFHPRTTDLLFKVTRGRGRFATIMRAAWTGQTTEEVIAFYRAAGQTAMEDTRQAMNSTRARA